MATRAEIFRYQMERAGLGETKHPRRLHRDFGVDTALPGVSASDRRAGGGSSAARNFSPSAGRKAVYVLEDSATRQPSRRSTRKSANRANPSHSLCEAKEHALLRIALHRPS